VNDYVIRAATLDDIDILVHHRIAMFTDMGTRFDARVVASAFREWLRATLASGEYVAWVCETGAGEIVGGAGITLVIWPPGPRDIAGDRIAFVYNVYTEPAHRKRGIARLIMEAIHAWCREHGIGALALNAASAAAHLYKSLGYSDAPSPMMWKIL